jgi:hypothetical protein
MVDAGQAAVFSAAEEEGGSSMRAMLVQEADAPVAITKSN